ncbi:MAG: M48 family metallopeptidase [Rhodospirillaceae bacterium]|nr:M48 family metallopeptidase [Rhodospirillaceae bacterium]
MPQESGPWGVRPGGEPPAEPGPRPVPPAPAGLRSDFLAAQRANRRNTLWLVVALLLLGAGLGYVVGLAIDVAGRSAPLAAPSPLGVVLAAALVGIGAVASAVTFLAGDRVILRLANAREVTPDEEPVLHNVVEEMAIAAGLPKPRVAVIETDSPNAFATGMRPEAAAIGVTRGLLKSLNREELQGVIGHEMSHIANWDTRYMTAVGILVGLIALVSDAVLRGGTRMIGFGAAGRRGGSRKGGGGGAVLIVLVLVVFAILAPIAAQLVRFAVSRQREYLADASSVQLTRNPVGLIGALRKLAASAEPFKGANRATQHMFIVNPVRSFGERTSALFATHPPIEARIRRLQNLG